MKVTVDCEREVAFDSPDHIVPEGTKNDNSRFEWFNKKLYRLYGNRPISVLDLGCSGGGFVRDCINDGCLAVGLEGSDYSKIHRRAEWAIIPEFLHTCDITKKFQVYVDGKPHKFEAITSWEVMEHIHEKDIAGVCENVKRHLKEGWMWIMSVTTTSCIVGGVDLHQTAKSKEWWIERFASNGLHPVEAALRYFDGMYVRGRNMPTTFHLVLAAEPGSVPAFPRLSLRERLKDWWFGSELQPFLRAAVTGTTR